MTSAAGGLAVIAVSESGGGNVNITNDTGTLNVNSGVQALVTGDVTLTTVGAGHNVAFGASGFADAVGGNPHGRLGRYDYARWGSVTTFKPCQSNLNAVAGIGTVGAPVRVSTATLGETNTGTGDVFLATTNNGAFGTTGVALSNTASPGTSP